MSNVNQTAISLPAKAEIEPATIVASSGGEKSSAGDEPNAWYQRAVLWLVFTIKSGLARFATLKACPRELWIVYGLKFLESYAYFSMSLVLTLYLSEFGYSDSEAGWIYGLFGTLTSAYGMAIGFVIDNLGVRVSLIVGAVLLTIGRLVIAITTSKLLVLVLLYSILPLGSALGIPVMMTGIRRYTNDTNRSFGFSLFYSVMNIAAMLAGYLVDALRKSIDESTGKPASCDAQSASGLGGAVTSFSAYRVILLTGAGASFVMLALSFFAIREIGVDQFGVESSFTPRRESPIRMIKTLLTEKSFWRFVLFVTILIGVKSVFRHLDATLPKFMIRSMGCSADYGTIYSINPILVIILVPIVTAYTMHIPCFKQILVGSFITGLSVLFAIMAATYTTLVLFMILLAFGEALWSPRLYEYSATIAPVGREGTYMALATVPTFVATVFTGGMSGWLLSTFCPCVKSACESCCPHELAPGASGCPDYRIMWSIVFGMTIASPVLLALLQPIIEDPTGADPAEHAQRGLNTETKAKRGPGDGEAATGTETEMITTTRMHRRVQSADAESRIHCEPGTGENEEFGTEPVVLRARNGDGERISYESDESDERIGVELHAASEQKSPDSSARRMERARQFQRQIAAATDTDEMTRIAASTESGLANAPPAVVNAVRTGLSADDRLTATPVLTAEVAAIDAATAAADPPLVLARPPAAFDLTSDLSPPPVLATPSRRISTASAVTIGVDTPRNLHDVPLDTPRRGEATPAISPAEADASLTPPTPAPSTPAMPPAPPTTPAS